MTNAVATAPATSTLGSAIVAALEAVYDAVRQDVPDLPPVVFITGSGLMGMGAKWGHFGRDRWVASDGRVAELFIAGERLECGAELTLQTVLHEAAHALAAARGVKDTSRDHRYHNKRFVALAEELGLCWPDGQAPHPTIGFSAVILRPETVERYASLIADLQAAIVAHMDTFKLLGIVEGGGQGGGDGGERNVDPTAPLKRPAKPKSNRTNLKATCGCGRVIRASRKVLAEGLILCGSCGDSFIVAE